MGKIEDIIAKDRITASNQEMFDSICRRIEKEQQNRLPFAVGLSVKLACCLVILLSAVNFIAFENNEEVQTVDEVHLKYSIHYFFHQADGRKHTR